MFYLFIFFVKNNSSLVHTTWKKNLREQVTTTTQVLKCFQMIIRKHVMWNHMNIVPVIAFEVSWSCKSKAKIPGTLALWSPYGKKKESVLCVNAIWDICGNKKVTKPHTGCVAICLKERRSSAGVKSSGAFFPFYSKRREILIIYRICSNFTDINYLHH